MNNTDDDFAELVLIPGVGRAKARALFNAGYRTLEEIGKADTRALAKVPGIGLDLARSMQDFAVIMASAAPKEAEPEAKGGLFICPLCGSMVGAGSSACPGCGITFSDEVDDDIEPIEAESEIKEDDGFWYKKNASLFICPECGSLVSDAGDSCPKCGVQFDKDEGEAELPDLPSPAGEDDGYWYKTGDSTLFMCPNCGSFITKDADGCSACGIVFENGGEEDAEERPETLLCPMCKSSLPAGADSCGECGFDFNREKESDGFWYKDQTELFMCPDCGAFIPKSASKCGICGAVLEEDDGSEPAPPVAETCPMCKGELAPGMKSCKECGYDPALEKDADGFWYKDSSALFICPGCGAFISEAANSCLNCGLVFEGAEADEEKHEPVIVKPEGASEPGSDLEKQVDDLIELVEMEDILEAEASGKEEIEDAEDIGISAQEALYLCPICGAFIQSGMSKCPSCAAVFDDIEEMELEPVGSVLETVIDNKELAREMATEIEEIEAELLEPPKQIAERKGGVSKDFLDRWKKLDVDDESEILGIVRKKAAETKTLSPVEIDAELGLDEAPEDRDKNFGYWRDRARDMASIGKVEEAVALLDRAVELNPEREMEYKRLMLEIMGIGSEEKAVDISDMVSIDDIGDLSMDEALISSKNLEKLEEVERRLAKEPENGVLWQEKGELLEKLGRHSEAVACFDKSISISYSELRKDAKAIGRAGRLPQPGIGLTNGMGRVNGTVNGLLSQRGLVSGSLSGMVNGKVNGLSRGKVNGFTRPAGKVNGMFSGRTNGKVNGLTNGMLEGRVNGTGLINGTGLGLINGGLVNGLGLVNGEGMVNGMGSLRRLRQRRRERIIWRYRLTAMVLFVTLVLMISMIGNMVIQEESGNIYIDGNFAEWNGVSSYYNFLSPAQRLNIMETRMAIQNGRINMLVLLEGDAFDGAGVDSVWALADLDRNPDTGYSMGSMGVDLAVEVYGWNGTLMGTQLLRFDSSADADDWNGFVSGGGVAAAFSGQMLEIGMTIPREMASTATDPAVLMITLDSDGNSDITDYLMAPEGSGTVATFSIERSDILLPGALSTPLGTIALSAHNDGGSAINAFEFTVTGNGNAADLPNPSLTDASGNVVPATVSNIDAKSFRITLSQPMHMNANTTLNLGLEADVSAGAANKAVGISMIDINSTRQGTVVRNVGSGLWNIGVPTGMRVDGAFGDWASVSGNADITGDVIVSNSNSSFINSNIDIVENRFAVFQDSLFFQVSVQGVMMGGEALPTIRFRSGSQQPTEYLDSDRDSVPDAVDPHPHDFTNDGTIDSEMVTSTGEPDVDGDDAADYPHGPDWWLNTTILAYFPEPYTGMAVSIYIGPVSTKYIEQKGDDRLYLLIDSDDDPSTGQNLRGGTGVDHVLIISGKNNRILASELYAYDPGNSETGWAFMANASAALDWSRMEGAVALSRVSLSAGSNFTIFISTEDWRGGRDSMDAPFISTMPSGASGTRSPAGNNVVLNEVFAFGTADWAELCNPTAAPINIGGWTLTRQGNGNNYVNIQTFPAGTTLGAFGSGSEYISVALGNLLTDAARNLRLNSGNTIVDQVQYLAPTAGTSYARLKNQTFGMPQDTDAAGDWYTSPAPTRGAPNERTAPSIVVSKSSEHSVMFANSQATYTIWYNNTGTGNAKHVWVNDTLPAGLTYSSSSIAYSSNSGQTYGWYFTNVAPGEYSFTITVDVSGSLAQGTVLTNTANLRYTDQLSRLWGSSSDSFISTVSAPSPILTLTKTVNNPTPVPTETVTFTIQYNNIGAASAPHVWLNDTLPAGVTYVSASPAPASVSGQNVLWYFQDVAIGSYSITLRATIGAGVSPGLTLINTVTADYKNSAGMSQPQLQAQASMVVASAARSIVINEVISVGTEYIELCNPSAAIVNLGGWQLQYQQGNWRTLYTFLSFENIGPWGSGGEYRAISIAGTIPDASKPMRLIEAGGRVVDATTYTTMAAGQSWSRFKHEDTGKPIDTDSDSNDFYISNNGWIVPEGPTPGAANDRKRPVMEIEKTASVATAEPGQTVIYTITYRNIGDGNAKNVWVNDTLPSGIDFASSSPAPTSISGQNIVWYFNNVNHGTTNSITLTTRVNSTAADSSVLTNTASLVYHDALRRPMGSSTASASLTFRKPVITVAKVADVATASAGDTIAYTIYYNNTGSANAGSVWINDTLPAGVSYVSASPAPATVSGQSVAWHLINVAPGSHSITITVTVDSNATGTLTNWAFLDYSSAYAWKMNSSSDSAVVEIPEMRHLAIPIFGIMFIAFIYHRKGRRGNGKEI